MSIPYIIYACIHLAKGTRFSLLTLLPHFTPYYPTPSIEDTSFTFVLL